MAETNTLASEASVTMGSIYRAVKVQCCMLFSFTCVTGAHSLAATLALLHKGPHCSAAKQAAA